MNDHLRLEQKKKKGPYNYPTNFDRLRCLQRRLKVVAYDLEVPEMILEGGGGLGQSIKLSESEQARLNSRLASVINCLVVSEKIQ